MTGNLPSFSPGSRGDFRDPFVAEVYNDVQHVLSGIDIRCILHFPPTTMTTWTSSLVSRGLGALEISTCLLPRTFSSNPLSPLFPHFKRTRVPEPRLGEAAKARLVYGSRQFFVGQEHIGFEHDYTEDCAGLG